MELFDYVRFRWKTGLALLIVGIAVILYLGQQSGGGPATARAQLLVRPPSNQTSGYGSDTDRYIATQETLMFTPDYLNAMVQGTDITAAEMARALGFSHNGGTETLTLEATDSNKARAVTLVNAAANGYLAYAKSLADQPGAQQAAALHNQIVGTRKNLGQANAVIKRTVAAYIAANPDSKLPNSATIAPRAFSEASLATNRLQNLLQQQAALDLSNSEAVFRSSLLRPAAGATREKGWSHTTYAAAGAGLLLLILVLAGVGLALTGRVISRARWNAVVADGHLGRSVRIRRLTRRQREQSARRVVAALSAAGEVAGQTWVVSMPEPSRKLQRKTTPLMERLGELGSPVSAKGSLSDLLGHGPSTPPADLPSSPDSPDVPAPVAEPDPERVLLLVDLNQARVDDVAVLTDYPEHIQRMIVPVLV